ncbi:peroxiredoxin [Cryptosporangium aurantiacum]|uniref:thioredoxin-dependent peroxiredoxin n=1 Tax=Cryptosporangium aurantiacum TaxID=134849 RepID=A0A1M7Q6W1_9ACTN|nr:peroxiredoxin [Cryptosporangium aurantiacum]SHN26272.1 peroxiredoxin Q/BCP [Cryptosporangium aurantiacum]
MDTGDLAPDFELPDQDGVPRRLTTLLAEGGPVVLFFYPAAMSPGCTAESCHFRDLAKEFAAVGAQRIGISNDRVEVQQEFAGRHSLDYPLLSDLGGVVAAEYGVKRRLGPLAVKRHTFVIDVDRRLLAVIRSELRMSVHADKALEVLRARPA